MRKAKAPWICEVKNNFQQYFSKEQLPLHVFYDQKSEDKNGTQFHFS